MRLLINQEIILLRGLRCFLTRISVMILPFCLRNVPGVVVRDIADIRLAVTGVIAVMDLPPLAVTGVIVVVGVLLHLIAATGVIVVVGVLPLPDGSIAGELI